VTFARWMATLRVAIPFALSEVALEYRDIPLCRVEHRRT
jgi:hypothetical protein